MDVRPDGQKIGREKDPHLLALISELHPDMDKGSSVLSTILAPIGLDILQVYQTDYSKIRVEMSSTIVVFP